MTKKTHLAREMSARHIQMIALGGVCVYMWGGVHVGYLCVYVCVCVCAGGY